MTDMRSLIDSLKQTEAIVEAEMASISGPAMGAGPAFGAWSQNRMEPEASVIFHAGAMLGRQLRHVLERHPEFTFEESKGEHDTKFTVKGPADFLEALKRIVAKLTDSEKVVDEAETIETHATREPTDEENDQALEEIAALVKDGYTSGQSTLSTGARYSWTLAGDAVVEDDEFAQEYVAGLIGEGYREGHNPRWTLAINIWGDRLEAELEEGHDELTYPDGEVYHTEYDAPGEGDRVQDQHGRTGTAQGNAPSKHGHEFSPEVYVEWDDEPGQVYPTTADELTIIPHEQIEQEDDGMRMAPKGPDVPHTIMAHYESSRPGEWHFVGTFPSYEEAEQRSNHLKVMGGKAQHNIRRATQDEIDEFLGAGAHGLDEDMTFGSDFDDGIADTEVLGLDDTGASDVGADYCYGSPTGEHHFIEGECVDCGQDESFEVDEQDVDQDDFETPGFSDEERIPR